MEGKKFMAGSCCQARANQIVKYILFGEDYVDVTLNYVISCLFVFANICCGNYCDLVQLMLVHVFVHFHWQDGNDIYYKLVWLICITF